MKASKLQSMIGVELGEKVVLQLVPLIGCTGHEVDARERFNIYFVEQSANRVAFENYAATM
jgi:hypothetical protein